jgi:hypothetical protein
LRKLILHIGAHKTGSTSIQGFLYRNREALAEQSWELISNEGALNLSNLVSFRLSKTGRAVYSFKPDALEKLELKLQAASRNCVISAEDFFFINDIDAIRSLKKTLSQQFEKITVLLYLRRQTEMAVSQKAQGAKTIQSAITFGNSPFPLPEITGNVIEYLEYDSKLDLWSKYFGRENLLVRIYERPRLIEGDVVSDFIVTTGIPVTPEPLVLNESLGEQATLFLHYLRYSGVPHSVLWPLLKSRRIDTPPGPRSQPSRAEAETFQANFDRSNMNLFAGLKLAHGFDESFDQYPPEPILPQMDFAFAERNLRVMISILVEVANVRSAQLFRYAARELRQSDPEMADSLLDLAGKSEDCKDPYRSVQPHFGCPAPEDATSEELVNTEEGARIISQYVETVKQLAEVANDINVNLYITAADALETTDPKTAEELMMLARTIRPYGPYIRHKLAQYEEQRKLAEAAAVEASFLSRVVMLLHKSRLEFLAALRSENTWSALLELVRRIKAKIF